MSGLRPTGSTPELGFSFLEVLITTAVISVGLLGLASLQFAGLRVANKAHEHTLAALLAQDIEERIRANTQGAANGAYNNVTIDGRSSPRSSTVDCNDNACSGNQFAVFDVDQWRAAISPSGNGNPILPNASIIITSHDGTNFEATIRWGRGDNPHTLTAGFSRL